MRQSVVDEATTLNCPCCAPRPWARCFYEPEAQDIDVDLLMTLYRKMAQIKLISTHPKLPPKVTGLRWQRNSWSLETSAGHFEGEASLVNAAGAWAILR